MQKQRLLLLPLILLVVLSLGLTAHAQAPVFVRPPAVPLVAVDPYFSIWSPADKLTDAATTHWTEAPNRLTSLLWVDGQTFRLMGNEPADIPALEQTGLEVLPTTVTYTFQGGGVRVQLSFMTPLLPDDLMIFSRPITYLTWQVAATDGRTHDVQIHYDNTAELVVNHPESERVTWAAGKFDNLPFLRVGSVSQKVLGQKGDRVRINWGYQYVSVPLSQHARTLIAPAEAARYAWEGREIPSSTETSALASAAPVLSVNFDLGKVGRKPVSRWLMLAYDDVYAAQYFGKNLRDYWRKDGADIADLLLRSAVDYENLRLRCAKFDKELMTDLQLAAGRNYAKLCALAYRQSLAASKLVADENGQPLYFCKENTSNGCMGTADVFYPQAPLPLLISPSLAKAMLIPMLAYASSPRWVWPNAPHDLGTWPLANGQAYGGAKSDGKMPVEESGNLLLLVDAVAQAEGNADFAAQYWPALTKWAVYLQDYGRDPANQLCTDDFAGHLAHNANLAAKAICALGAYGQLATMVGERVTGKKHTAMAKEFAKDWIEQADDGDHFRLAFDQTNSWSSKYNLVWDKILGLNLFPDEVLKKEMEFYRQNIDTYGLPLDGRKRKVTDERSATWSKTDWAFWTACLTGNRADFDDITEPVYKFFNETTRRVGLADLYYTDKPDSALMHSRPVIGGVFIKMLYDRKTWQKWAARDQTRASGPWAALPEAVPAVVSAPPAANASSDWPATVDAGAAVHYFVVETNAFTIPAGGNWQPSLFFADEGDQAFDTIHINGTNGLACLKSTDAFMNLADTNYTVWAAKPSLDVLIQVYGNDKLFDADGKGREVIFRTGPLGHEHPVSGGSIPPGIATNQWNWLLFTVPNEVNPATGKRYIGFVPNPNDPGVECGGVNRGTLRLEHVPGLTLRAAAIGPAGAFGVMKQPNVFEPKK